MIYFSPHMDENVENTEQLPKDKFTHKDTLKSGLILLGAIAFLVVKGYVSGKLLMALVILDYFTTELIRKIPLPLCFIISIAMIVTAFSL